MFEFKHFLHPEDADHMRDIVIQEGCADEEESASYKHMEDRDRRRWDMADEDKDGTLTMFEFKHFLHPEDADHMRDIVIQETIEDIDKDGDGRLSIGEYIDK